MRYTSVDSETGEAVPESLVFVHLSDLHFRAPGSPLAEREAALRERLLDDIPEVVRLATGKLEAILLTGDLARAGKKAEYDEARAWLDRLCRKLGIHETKTLTCPGNHDVDLDRVDAGRHAINASLRSCPENLIDATIDRLLADEPDKTLAPLENYQEFAAGYACDIERCLAWEIQPINFAGGYQLVIRGANSVINSDKLDGEGTMAVHSNQLLAQATPGIVRMLLLHHGTSFWRRPKPGPSEHDHNIVLYGHTHTPDHNMASAHCLEITAGAVHPEEHKFSIPSYNVIELSVVEDPDDPAMASALVRVFHRSFSKEDNRFIEIPDGAPQFEEMVLIPKATGDQADAAGIETALPPAPDQKGTPVTGEPELQPPLEDSVGQPEPSRQVRLTFEGLGSGDRLTLLERLGLPRDEIAALPPHKQIREVARQVLAKGLVVEFLDAAESIGSTRSRTEGS